MLINQFRWSDPIPGPTRFQTDSRHQIPWQVVMPPCSESLGVSDENEVSLYSKPSQKMVTTFEMQ